MHSSVVVISWWSNCLALKCLHRLTAFARGREFYVMQAGKSDDQKDRFRAFMPADVNELLYPDHLPADDSTMREYLAKEALHDREGLWFFDHDAFILEPSEAWFRDADVRFAKSNLCLCTRQPMPRAGVTQPAYWLSPRRWPDGLSSFAPVPFEPRPYVRRPDLQRHDGQLTLPDMDTLEKVRSELDALDLTGTFPTDEGDATAHFLPSFPPHLHLGGLHLYTGPTEPPASMPASFRDWRRHTLMCFEAFFRNSPPEWMAIEDPELLRRHEEMTRNAEALGWRRTSG